VATTFGETTAREALAETVRPHLEGESRVGFPAILGDERADAVRADLADRLGVDVFEVPMGPPSLPGMRLEDLLYDALEAGRPGDDRGSGGRLRDRRGRNGPERSRTDRSRRRRPERQRDSPPRRPVRARDGRTGRKGRTIGRERVFEPIFDCHVPHAADRYDWFVDDVFGDQPYARFGLPVDRDLRPLDASDEPEFSNLRSAGAVLGGYDFAAEKSGAGVSLATGYVAGRRAASEGER